MHKMSNFEYSFLIRELQPLIMGRHFSRMRRLGENSYRIKIGSVEILSELGIRLHIATHIDKAEGGDKFTDKIEKELSNTRLNSIEQINKDRILSFSFSRGGDVILLVFEMFGDGNLVLVGKEGKIICAHRYESWSDREIRVGVPYHPPKNLPSSELVADSKYIIVSLAKLPIGKDYVAEALTRLGIDEKTPGDSLSGNKISAIEFEIKKIVDTAVPCVFYTERADGSKVPCDFSLTKLSRYAGLHIKQFKTLSEAAEEYYINADKPNPRLEKLSQRLAKQKERLVILIEEERSLKEKGDLVYGKYSEVERVLSAAKLGDFDQLEKKFGAKIDKKEKSIDIEL